ncbi:MAG: fatty acid desaturase family protein [Pseudobdellovibrionaceae bacterium]
MNELGPAVAENLRPQSFYTKNLYKKLPANIFEPVAARLLWFAGYLAVVAVSALTIKYAAFPWYVNGLLSLLLGISFGALGFFTHELLHGSVIRNRKVQDFLGFFGFMPFFISPTFWRYWHNNLHHSKTQAIIADPDAFPTMKIFKHSLFMQRMFPFTPGSGHKRSYTYLMFWFSFHVFVAQMYLRFRNSLFDKLNHRRVTIEFAAQILIWGSFLWFLGPQNLVWTFVIPFLAQNYFVMSYIATNHNLSPLTKINDPLVNSLTVTNPSWLEFLHLNFGYHVEHHIFPTLSGLHAKKVHALLKQEYPNTFQVMPKSKAVGLLYKSARIYKTSKVLIHPKTLQTYATLGNQEQAAAAGPSTQPANTQVQDQPFPGHGFDAQDLAKTDNHSAMGFVGK